MVLFDRAVHGMAPAFGASIIPLLPTISHFAFDFQSRFDRNVVDHTQLVTCYVPPLTAPFRALLNTRWFHALTQPPSRKRKL
jgi:hypothetical protein